jgi:hypothetical protein
MHCASHCAIGVLKLQDLHCLSRFTVIAFKCAEGIKKVKGKAIPVKQVVETHKVVRRRGSHIF